MRARLANRSSSPPGPCPAGGPSPEAARASAIPGSLRFAARSVDVTPPPGSPLAGYLARGSAPAEGALDPLEATLIRLRDPRSGGETVTWVALDAIAVDVALAGAIADAVGAASGVPADAVVVCASHTHAGPGGWMSGIPFAAPEPGDPAMRAELVRRTAQAAASLAGDEVQVRPMLAVGEARGVGTHRTDPGLPSERTIGALSLIDEQGAVVGLLVDHASHATVLGHDNRRWSADWPGAARRTLAASLRDRAPFAPQDRGRSSYDGAALPSGRPTDERTPVVAYLQGAAGDSSPRFVRRSQTPAEVDRIGGLFAAQALQVILRADDWGDEEPVVAIRRRRVQIRTRELHDPLVLAARVAAAEQEWRAAASQAGTGTPTERIARTRHEGALTAASLAEAGLPPWLDLPVSVVVIGHDAWLHVPVELFSSHAAEIRARSPFRHTRVIGYADGYFGYVADAEAHRLETYEAASSLFDAAGARTLVDASIALLTQSYGELWPGRDRA